MKDVDWPMWPTATVPLANPGLLVGERYELRSQIGVGAMGAVWLAQDQRLNRAVALKQVVLEPGLDHRQATEARQRILREGRIAARLQHPHAVSIYDVAVHEGEPWLVMEYMPSRSLAAVLTEDGLLCDWEAARVGLQLADALDAAHEAGIVHRDVKPGNVLIGQNGTAKLVDFGIARASGDVTVTQTGVLTGTPDYFAPEVARGAKPTPEADIFALGATLYICVEGQPPFGTNKNALTQLQVVADGAVRAPRQAGRLTPVLRKLLAAEPADRPSAREASELLRAVAYEDGEPAPRSRPVTDPARRTGPDPISDPRTTKIPPPRSAPESWMPSGRALPPTPRELAAKSVIEIPTGRAAHRVQGRFQTVGLDMRRRLIVIAVAAVAALAVLTLVMQIANAGKSQAAASPAGGAGGAVSAVETTRKASDDELTAAARTYFAMLPHDAGGAWHRLSSRAQLQLGGQSAYTAFWSDISSLKLISTSTSSADQSVRAQLQLETTDGQPRTSTQKLVVIPGPGGQWLIDVVSG
jgi:serine/threonine protein kinase